MVDNKEYIGMLRELILSGKEVSLMISGSSMSPFLIHKRDSVILAPVKGPLKRGAVVFFQRQDGSYVLHRIYKVRKNDCYDIVGDAQTQIEPNVKRSQIFAAAAAVKRKGKIIGPGDFWWEFFEHVWIRMIPMRRWAVSIYRIVVRGGKKGENK